MRTIFSSQHEIFCRLSPDFATEHRLGEWAQGPLPFALLLVSGDPSHFRSPRLRRGDESEEKENENVP